MIFTGVVKSYSPNLRCGYLSLEDYEDILFYLKDLPYPTIAPTVGEKLEFKVSYQQEKLTAGQIIRPEISVHPTFKQYFKNFYTRLYLQFKYQPEDKQHKILILAGLALLLSCIGLVYVSQHYYQRYQVNKTQKLMLQQKQQVAKQREALGELPDVILSEEARQNMSAQVLGTTKPRSEQVSHSIDKLNGRLPVEMGKFKCDGRVYCSEMRSYAEAVYFHKHCRGTKMDGNGNGKPCENDTRWANVGR